MFSQQEPDNIPLRQKLDNAQWVCMYPALSVMVLLRRNLGYRIVSPGYVIGVALVMFLIGSFSYDTPYAIVIQMCAVPVVLAGLYQRIKRWREVRRGIRHHSYYIGDSIFNFRWLPKFITNNRRLTRLVDPLLCIGFGIYIYRFCKPVGAWLTVSGFCLRFFEDAVHSRDLDRDLDLMDNLVMAEVQADTVDHFSEPSESYQQHHQPTDGLATGLGDDLQEKIKRRKNNKANK